MYCVSLLYHSVWHNTNTAAVFHGKFTEKGRPSRAALQIELIVLVEKFIHLPDIPFRIYRKTQTVTGAWNQNKFFA